MANFTFLYPLWFLALIPLGLLVLIQRKNKNTTGLIAPHIAKQLGMTQKTQGNGFTLGLVLAWICVTTALAGPSFGYKDSPSFQLSGARVLVMDMSRSVYATDVKPNRLTQEKYKAKDLLPYWKEGMTGLVAYGADSYLVSPLTEDSQTLNNLITNLSPEIMPYKGKGSNLLAAVNQSIEMMTKSGHQQGDIIVLTDGISNQQLDKVMSRVKGSKWRISLLGIGTKNGAPIELPSGQLLTDASGKTVVATLDSDPLVTLAQATNGVAQLIQSDNSDIETIARLTKTPLDQVTQNSDNQVNSRANHGYWLLFPLVLFSLLCFRKGMFLALFLVLLPVDKSMASTELSSRLLSDDYSAYQQFEQKDYQAASEQFKSKQWKGAAQYKAGDYKGTIESLTGLEDTQSQYNLANALAQNGQLEEAKEKYESLLKTNPDMKDAKKNLDIVNKALEQKKNDESYKKDKDGDTSLKDDPNGEKKQQEDSKDGSEQSSDSKDSPSQDSQQDQQDQQKNESQSDDKSQSDKQDKSEASSQEQQQKDQAKKEQEKKDKEQAAQARDKEDKQPKSDEEKERQAQMQSQQAKADSDAIKTDPRLQKLEQSGAKEDELLRALLYLQAKQQEAPQASENEW
ncbi:MULTISPECIES: vWA domain-containing protein [Aliivibrio]|uniref:VWA domain-containing protein n=1 Tax=Aliivibrio finisterrensis TaxID=511998 RepID=A0A4Q5KRU7_9GAMM|nr:MULTISPECIES: VWA domain-containing protein [Aliivibrio]MDD9179991.1 VWA domain-containing protein [Aliivibrio sp. A6]RYU49794.1 VWA domain-containing protein [Aliivibrio finisterrensis]RYU51313.1 VWA domain-containing protein [Aliivibrio finisterrensis]RYU56374.1 VWA domain-containing protein [Aliivibrio finisterrensis]RYU63878.1 VWA domain-containing protein [Aliivibrio finisterrensis]